MSAVADTSVMYLPGIGPQRAKLLEQELHIKTYADLLWFFPYRYIDRSRFYAISEITDSETYVQFKAVVRDIRLVKQGGKGQRLSVWVADATGEIELLFFKGLNWIQNKLQVGGQYIIFGKATAFQGRINLVHPDVDPPSQASATPGLQGIYPATQGLKDKGFTQKVLGRAVAELLKRMQGQIPETLPEVLVKELRLMPLALALHEAHLPRSTEALQQARTRLKFEELFYIQLGLLKQRGLRLTAQNGLRFPKIGPAFNACYQSLPFPLTGAQKRVIKEIRADMASGHQMNRLLQGDVGSGKTLVALLCALIAIDNGYQACLMAPTEILAKQHAASLRKMLSAVPELQVGLLTGSTKAAERKSLAAGLEEGSIQLLVGTHALLEDNVTFSNLGFVVIDEQHRFGVAQRSRLWQKSRELPPHVLVMTATPIPRTLAMTLYGDLDVSVIDELPPGRRPIKTLTFNASKRDSVFAFMRSQIREGRQIYVVFPLIHESETLDYQNLEAGYQEIIRAFPTPKYITAVVHGQQAAADKEVDMQTFARGSAHILVATSVIEVGVDVPNATVMVIESAERFGLSQLHQLRGRVGRGAHQSYCILLTGNKLSKEAQQRIQLMCDTSNGFELAEADMRLRGPGDLEGTAQSGLAFDLKVANLSKDGQILEWARQTALTVLDRDPRLETPAYALLRQRLKELRSDVVDYSQIS